MEKNLELNGLIYGKFPNMAAFAREIGISRQRLYSYSCGRTEPPLEDLVKIANSLGEPVEKIVNIFLAFKSTKSTKKTRAKCRKASEILKNN